MKFYTEKNKYAGQQVVEVKGREYVFIPIKEYKEILLAFNRATKLIEKDGEKTGMPITLKTKIANSGLTERQEKKLKAYVKEFKLSFNRYPNEDWIEKKIKRLFPNL